MRKFNIAIKQLPQSQSSSTNQITQNYHDSKEQLSSINLSKHQRAASGLQQHQSKLNKQRSSLDPLLSQRKKVFCGEHLEEVVHTQQSSNGQIIRQYCKECLFSDQIASESSSSTNQLENQMSSLDIENSFRVNLEQSQTLLIKSNQAIKQFASLYSKSNRLINDSVKDLVKDAKNQIIQILDDYFDQSNCTSIRDRIFGEQVAQLATLQEQYQNISCLLTNLNEQAFLNYRHVTRENIDINRILDYNQKIENYKDQLNKLNLQYKQLSTQLLNLDKINQLKNNYREKLEEDLYWHISSLFNHSPLKRREQEFILQNLSYSDDETEHAKRLVNNINTNQFGLRRGRATIRSNRSNFNIMDSFRAHQSIEYSENNSVIQGSDNGNTIEQLTYRQCKSNQSLEQGDNEEDEEEIIQEAQNKLQKEAFSQYLDEQLERIHKMQNQQYTSLNKVSGQQTSAQNQHQNQQNQVNSQVEFNITMHNNEIQRLKDVVQREEENSKQRLIKLKQQKEEELEKFKTVTNVKYQLQTMIKKDLYYIKGDSQELFIFDFDTQKFKSNKFENFTQKFPKNFSSIQRLNRDIFLFGGIYMQNKYSQKTFQIKMNQNKYKQQICEKAQMISPKINIPICLIKNRYVYLCGGFYNKMLTDCDIYSIEEDRWFEGPKLNYPRANCALCPFDDRFIYIFCGKALNESTLIIEKLDAGLHGSSNLMKSIDEDLSLSLDYKWEAIEIKDQKDFISNMHFNGLFQISPTDILIFGGQNRQSYKFVLDFKNDKETLVKLEDKFNIRQMTKFVYEKDFQAVIQNNKLYAIDPNYKTVHMLEINKLIEDSNTKPISKNEQAQPNQGTIENKETEEQKNGQEESKKQTQNIWANKIRQSHHPFTQMMSPGPSKPKVFAQKSNKLKKSFQEQSFNNQSQNSNINLNNSQHTDVNNSVWEIKTFKEIGINVINANMRSSFQINQTK